VNKVREADLGTPAPASGETVKNKYRWAAVQVTPAKRRSKWQHAFDKRAKVQGKILETS